MAPSGGGRSWRRGARWLAWLLLPTLGLLAWACDPLLPLESGPGLKALFQWRGVRPPPPGVVVVAIDERSAASFGLPERPRQWPRRLHAELVDRLQAAGVGLVAFDLTFDTPSPDDERLARSLRQSGRVLVTSSLRRQTWRQAQGDVVVEQAQPAVPVIGAAALDQAPFVLPKDARIDGYWTFRRDADHLPSLPVLAFHLQHLEAAQAVAELACRDPGRAPCPSFGGEGTAPSVVVRQWRERFMADPGLAGRVARRLDDLHDVQLPAPRAQIETLLGLYAGDDRVPLNFYGPSRSIRTVSYADLPAVLAAEPALFRDAVVFVGFSAESTGAQDRLRDDYRTVFSDDSGVDMSGVEVAATAYANLVDGHRLRLLPPWAWAAWLLLWGLWLMVLAHRLSARSHALLSLASAVLLATTCIVAFAADWWLPWVVPLLVQWPAALCLALWLQGRRQHQRHDRLRAAFVRLVPRELADHLAQAAGDLTDSHRLVQGVCMATDVERYTALAESLPAQALGAQLNAYYARLFEPIGQAGGAVVDIVGDAMMAVWEAALDDVRQRRAACLAALAIQQRMTSPAAGGTPAWPTRIGLHAGEIRLGVVGASPLYQFRAVGDAVNTASRLEGLNKLLGTRVLASADMVRGLHGLWLRPLGSFRLAGKQAAIDVVEVQGQPAWPGEPPPPLLQCFADALAHYRAGELSDALAAFTALQRLHPEDGPTDYYVRHCRACLAQPTGHDPSLPIRVDAK